MDTEVIVGFVLTGALMVVFMLWTWHELRRIDEVAGSPPDEPED